MHPIHRIKALLVFIALSFAVSGVMSFHRGGTQVQSNNAGPAHKNETCFLVLSDIHLHSSLVQDAIAEGAADTGHDLWDSTQNKIRKVLAGTDGFAPPKFIVVLGDLPWHAKAAFPEELESARANSGQVLRDLRTLAENAHIPLVYVPGNNDPWEGDYHPFSTKIFNNDATGTWPLIHPNALNGTSEASLIDGSKIDMGYYSAYPLGKAGNLRVIALNSTIFSHKYTDEAHQQADATAQINWLSAQLEQAKSNNERVLITMHVPPGLDGYKKKDFWHKTMLSNGTYVQNAFIGLLDKYQDRVIGLLSSHTHMDGLRKIYSKGGKLIAVDISVPGITPGHGNNPGIKMVSYNPDSYALLNFTTLFENFYPAKKVTGWGADEFDFRTVFGCRGAGSMLNCLDTMSNETLQNGIQSIYKVKNGRGNADEINPAIEVRFE